MNAPALLVRPALRFMRGWRRLWGSVSFRLTFNYSLLAAITTIVVLFFVYVQLVNLLQAQIARQTAIEAHRLALLQQGEGAPVLIDTIRTLLADHTNIDVEMYLLMDGNGNRLVGNIDAFDADPDRLDKLAGSPVAVSRDGQPDHGFLRAVRLDNGWMLVVGRDSHELHEIKSLIAQAMLATTFIAFILVLAGTYIFRVALIWRVQDIRETARRVGTGELTRRVPDGAETDEFAGLRNDINQMLDRIEALMSGVRNVSDSVAHNIRTPLMRVLGKLDAAQAALDGAGAGPALDAIAGARHEINDMLAIAGKLLLIAEAESGVRRQAFRRVRVDEIADDVVDLFEPLAAEQGITLDHERMAYTGAHSPIKGGDGPQPPPAIWADADLLAGVLVNLVENAIKYGGKGAHVRIRSGGDDECASLVIEDDGPGVPPAQLPRLGTRFHRLDPATPGFGLGLASVQAIVSLHEGRLSFEDAAPGLRVRIEFPAA